MHKNTEQKDSRYTEGILCKCDRLENSFPRFWKGIPVFFMHKTGFPKWNRAISQKKSFFILKFKKRWGKNASFPRSVNFSDSALGHKFSAYLVSMADLTRAFPFWGRARRESIDWDGQLHLTTQIEQASISFFASRALFWYISQVPFIFFSCRYRETHKISAVDLVSW